MYTEDAFYLTIIITSLFAVVFNFVEIRKTPLDLGNPNSRQIANLSSIVFSAITAGIFSYIYFTTDEDFLIAGYIIGSFSAIATLFGLLYYLNIIQA